MSYGLTPVSVDTREQRMHVLKAYPRWVKYALEGNPFHAMWVWETHVAFAVRAACPWMWFDTQGDTMQDHEAIARLASNGDQEEQS